MGTEPKLRRRAGQAPSRAIPKQQGGILIRRLIRDLRQDGIALPLDSVIGSQILIACSGGADSAALAVLFAKYGRRLTERVTILHINHGWRGRQSDLDEAWVRRLAKRLGVGFHGVRLDPARRPRGASPEEWARRERKRIYEELASAPGSRVLTGHQADEVAETVFWRWMTGSAATHSGGILRDEGVELRPLLGCTKDELKAFLREEGIRWREDPSNHESDLLRARFRREIRPALSKLFPRWREHLLGYSREALQREVLPPAPEAVASVVPWVGGLLGAQGLRLKRTHWLQIQDWMGRPVEQSKKIEFHVEGGWVVELERVRSLTEQNDQSKRQELRVSLRQSFD